MIKNFTASFFSNNRSRCLSALPRNSVAVFFSGSELRKSADVFYPFYPNRNYYYLSGHDEPNGVLVLLSCENVKDSFLFVEEVSSDYERWFGSRKTPEEILKQTGLRVTGNQYDFMPWLGCILKKYNLTLFFDLWDYENPSKMGSIPREASQIIERYPELMIESVHKTMMYLRTFKSDDEIVMMRRGIKIADSCFRDLMKYVRSGMMEYQAKARFEYTAACEGITDMAFQPIIATGKNIFCIHYTGYKDPIRKNDLFLCDSGVNYSGVCCDISRTWPIDGWFTSEQEKYYSCALDASKTLFAMIRPGMQMRDIYRGQHRLMRRKLVEYGIAANEEEAKRYIWHGGAHHIGFDNHDEVYIENEPENLLMPNMVFAVDIGIYNPDSGIGLRIEDDCLVTQSGSENMTASIPSELTELRDILAQ